MDNFRVIEVIDGDTFVVTSGWEWNNQTGNRVRPAGYDAPEISTPAGKMAKTALSNLILNKTVQLGTAYRVDRGRLVCEVYFNGRNLAEYFKEFK